ncbi:MAG: hypothetical protein BGN88_06450 [Clostridiales bacterium 43-6]|nr:MAG: hypothetical protein BGN88_06450 [Clostridiales bacterium 43-6]
MNERERLLRRIAEVGFAMFELHLFLDTHPYDRAALQMFDSYQREEEALRLEFNSKYGPLNTMDVSQSNMWQWVKDPWPWDYSFEEGL